MFATFFVRIGNKYRQNLGFGFFSNRFAHDQSTTRGIFKWGGPKEGVRFFSVTSKWRTDDAKSIDFDTTEEVLWGKACVSFVGRACAHALATHMSHTSRSVPPVTKCPKLCGTCFPPIIGEKFAQLRAIHVTKPQSCKGLAHRKTAVALFVVVVMVNGNPKFVPLNSVCFFIYNIQHQIWLGKSSSVQWTWSAPSPGSLKALLFPPLFNKVQNKGTQGVQARYDTELPPFMSIVRCPSRPVILGMEVWQCIAKTKKETSMFFGGAPFSNCRYQWDICQLWWKAFLREQFCLSDRVTCNTSTNTGISTRNARRNITRWTCQMFSFSSCPQRRKNVHNHHRKKIIWRTFLASKKNFPGRWWIQKPYKNQENHIHHRNVPSVDPIFSAKKSSALEQGGVYFSFFLLSGAGDNGGGVQGGREGVGSFSFESTLTIF